MASDASKNKTPPGNDTQLADASSQDDVVHILAEQNKLLELAAKQALQRVEDDWLWPKAAMSAVTAIIALLAVCFFVPQYYTLSEISSRSKDFKTLVSEVGDKLNSYDTRFDAKVKEFSNANEKSLNSALIQQSINVQANMADVERAHHCLTLVAMGREHVLLKRNPHLAMLYADAAMNIFRSGGSTTPMPAGPSGDSAILTAIYPAIWNLQMDCLLQLNQFDQLKQLATQVIGSHTAACLDESKYCSLRSAFYNRALAAIPEISAFQQGVNPGRQDSEYISRYKSLGNQFLTDLENGIGGQADQSLGTIYKALFLISDGRYKDAQEAMENLRDASSRIKTRPTKEQAVTLQLASTAHTILDFITNKDKSDTAVKCNLDPSALTPWDAFLLEELVGLIVRRRSWHIQNNVVATGGDEPSVDYGNRLGIFCVNWILALRIACADGDSLHKICPNCSTPPTGDM